MRVCACDLTVDSLCVCVCVRTHMCVCVILQVNHRVCVCMGKFIKVKQILLPPTEKEIMDNWKTKKGDIKNWTEC